MCERPVNGFSWSPPGRALQADTMRKLVVLEDVVLKSAFQLERRTAAGCQVANRQGDGSALGPHVVERGGIQIERRRGALADETVHGKHFTVEKHLFESGKAEKNKLFMIQTVTSWKQTCPSRSKVISASQRREEALSAARKRDLRSSKDAEACKIAVQRRSSKWTSGNLK